jgi:hypothetical protein
VSTRSQTLLCLALLAIVGTALYYPMLDEPMRSFDDQAWIADTQVRNSWSTIFDLDLVTRNPFARTYFLPLQSALFYGMVSCFGPSPVAFHLLSLFIHVLACGLFFLLLVDFKIPRPVAFLGALLPLVHFSNIQSVIWVSASVSHPLVAVFIIATVLAYRRHLASGAWQWQALALVSFIVGLLIRETAVITPVLLFALEPQPVRQRLKSLVPFFLLTIPIFAIAIYKYEGGDVQKYWGGVFFGLKSLTRAGELWALMVFPLPLPLWGTLGVLAVLVSTTACLLRSDKRSLALFGVVWMIAGVLPYTISNIRPILDVTRYVYVGVFGFALLCALGATITKRRYIACAVFAVVAVLHFVFTFHFVHAH